MSEYDCDNPEEHCSLHACQLTASPRNPEVDKMFENPKFVCTNCGVKVNNSENVCRPKEI